MPDESQSSSQNLNSSSSGGQTDKNNQNQTNSYQQDRFSTGQSSQPEEPLKQDYPSGRFTSNKPSGSQGDFNKRPDQPLNNYKSQFTPKPTMPGVADNDPDAPQFKKGFIPLGGEKPFTQSLDSQKPETTGVQEEEKTTPFTSSGGTPFGSSSFKPASFPNSSNNQSLSEENEVEQSTMPEEDKKESDFKKRVETSAGWQPTESSSSEESPVLKTETASFSPGVEPEPTMTTGSLSDVKTVDSQPKDDQSLLQQAQAITGGSVKSSAGFKKILILLLVLLILFGLGWTVFKFVLPRFQKPKEVTLTYWGLWEPETVMKGVITDWEKAHPNVKINYLQQSPKEYRERLQSALARNEGPDIFRYHLTWLPMLKNELEALPPEVMSSAEYESTFYTVVKENLRSGTSYVGVPLGIDTLALFYNQEIFQAAGKTPPTSWDELRQAAINLTTRDETGRIQTAGVALGTTSNIDHWPDILGLMMLQNGVNLANPTGSYAEDALTYYTIFNTTDRVWDETLPNSTLAFATGKVAMYFGYSWDILEIKKINPSLDFKVVAMPQLPDTQVTWASFWVEGVAKKSSNSKQAWEFLKYLSSKEVLQKLYQAQSQTRLFGEVYPRTDMANLLADNPLLTPFANQVLQAKTWYLCSRTFDNGLNDKMIKYFEDAINTVNSGKSSTEALNTTAQGVSQLLSQYGLGSYVVR